MIEPVLVPDNKTVFKIKPVFDRISAKNVFKKTLSFNS